MYKDFSELISKVSKNTIKKTVAVVAAHDEHTLEAVIRAERDNFVKAVLIGQKAKILTILESLDYKINEDNIIDIENSQEGAKLAVDLCNSGDADFIMKGNLQTADLLRAVVDKEKGLRGDGIMSHLGLFQVPDYHKLIAITDGGMIPYPELSEKKKIIENAVEAYKEMGCLNPKVAILCAVESVNPKMPETLEAEKLKKMNQNGELMDCIVEGPISYDLAVDREAARAKGYESPVSGDADILLAPNIAAGNILAKSLVWSAKGKMAGIILGAKVPIVVTSRGATSEEKHLSLAFSASTSK